MICNGLWLVEKLGIPGKDKPIKFHVEYTATGGKYIGTSMQSSTLSEVIEKVFDDVKSGTIGRMMIQPVVLNEVCSFQLLTSSRI
jgi:hypothetical protein